MFALFFCFLMPSSCSSESKKTVSKILFQQGGGLSERFFVPYIGSTGPTDSRNTVQL